MILKNLIKKSGLVIAEIACGHNGSIDNFIKIIDELKKTNCRIIKSQIFITSERTSQDHSEWSIFKKLTLSPEQWFQIVKYAKKRGFFFFSDIFGPAGLNIAKNAGIDGYKIHTETLSDYSFIEKVLKTINDNLIYENSKNKKVTICINMTTKEELFITDYANKIYNRKEIKTIKPFSKIVIVISEFI